MGEPGRAKKTRQPPGDDEAAVNFSERTSYCCGVVVWVLSLPALFVVPEAFVAAGLW